MKQSQFMLVTAVLFLLSAGAFSQDQRVAKGEQVFLNATVLTNKDELVSGLRAVNFKIYEQNQLTPITSFTSGNIPMTIGILIDRSASTNGVVVPVIRKSLKKFISDSDRNNEYFLMSFSDSQQILLEPTTDNSKTLDAIENISDIAAQRTRFYDAVDAAAQKASTGRFQKRILIILSDGQDNDSKLDLGKVITASEKYGVAFYFIDLAATDSRLLRSGNPSSAQPTSGIIAGSDNRVSRSIAPRNTYLDEAGESMEDLARASGGLRLSIVTDNDLDKAFLAVSTELRSQYQIGVLIPKDADKSPKPKRRTFSIKLESLPKEVEKQKPRVRVRNKIWL